MLDSFFVSLAVATALGILAGLGVGGGSLLMLWLTAVLDRTQEEAAMLNLLFFLPAAGVSTLLRRKKQGLRFAPLLPALLTAGISVIIATFVSGQISSRILKRLFGILLIFTGLREIFYRPRKAR